MISSPMTSYLGGCKVYSNLQLRHMVRCHHPFRLIDCVRSILLLKYLWNWTHVYIPLYYSPKYTYHYSTDDNTYIHLQRLENPIAVILIITTYVQLHYFRRFTSIVLLLLFAYHYITDGNIPYLLRATIMQTSYVQLTLFTVCRLRRPLCTTRIPRTTSPPTLHFVCPVLTIIYAVALLFLQVTSGIEAR